MSKDKDVESQEEQAVVPPDLGSGGKTPRSRWRCLKLILHVRRRLILISLANTSTNFHRSLALTTPPPHSTVTFIFFAVFYLQYYDLDVLLLIRCRFVVLTNDFLIRLDIRFKNSVIYWIILDIIFFIKKNPIYTFTISFIIYFYSQLFFILIWLISLPLPYEPIRYVCSPMS